MIFDRCPTGHVIHNRGKKDAISKPSQNARFGRLINSFDMPAARCECMSTVFGTPAVITVYRRCGCVMHGLGGVMHDKVDEFEASALPIKQKEPLNCSKDKTA